MPGQVAILPFVNVVYGKVISSPYARPAADAPFHAAWLLDESVWVGEDQGKIGVPIDGDVGFDGIGVLAQLLLIQSLGSQGKVDGIEQGAEGPGNRLPPHSEVKRASSGV